ncbi:MAG: group III truncated hemoglobin [Bacteroidia bacterium]
MKRDIAERSDIELLVNSFYEKVLADESLKPFFAEAVKRDWQHHLNIMYDFWDNAIFFSGKYMGNPIMVHDKIHAHLPFQHQHFERWVRLFLSTVDHLFSGSNAELAKQRAMSIATVMQVKIFK